jgi:glyceraldehyde 3-phosphate dehydrogenase
VLNDLVGIERGLMTTSTPTPMTRRSWTRSILTCAARAPPPMSIIPTTTGCRPRSGRGAAGTEGQARRIGGARANAERQPGRPDFYAGRDTTRDEINAALKAASESGPLAGILDYTDEPLVSIDLNHNPASSTVDSLETAVIEGKLVRVVSWYDNEWGFSNRMVDTARAMAKLGLSRMLQDPR